MSEKKVLTPEEKEAKLQHTKELHKISDKKRYERNKQQNIEDKIETLMAKKEESHLSEEEAERALIERIENDKGILKEHKQTIKNNDALAKGMMQPSTGVITQRTLNAMYKKNREKVTCAGCGKSLGATYFFKTYGFVGQFRIAGTGRSLLCRQCMEDYYKQRLEVNNNKIMETMYELAFTFDFWFDEDLIKYYIVTGHADELPNNYLTAITERGEDNKYNNLSFYSMVTYGGEIKKIGDNAKLEAQMKEAALDDEDVQNRRHIIAMYRYDPFEKEENIERKKALYRNLAMMIDDTFESDLIKQRSALRVCQLYQEIDDIDEKVELLVKDEDASKEAAELLAKWKGMQVKSQETINKICQDNGFSQRFSRNDNKGASTLGGQMKLMEARQYDDAVVNFYDIATSQSIKECADISAQSIVTQLQFNDQEFASMVADQSQMIRELQTENDHLKEELRMVYQKITKQELIEELRQEYITKGMPMAAIEEVLQLEYHYPVDEQKRKAEKESGQL